MIDGTLTYQLQPLSNQEVLIINKKENKIIGETATDLKGHFAYKSTDLDVSGISLLIKIRTDNLIGVYYTDSGISSLENLSVNLKAEDFFMVNITVSDNNFYPDKLNVFVQPLKIQGVPAEQEALFNRNINQVSSSYFFHKPYPLHKIKFNVLKGTYKIGGDWINYDMPTVKLHQNFIVCKVTDQDDNTQVEGEKFSGYAVKIDKPKSFQFFLEDYIVN